MGKHTGEVYSPRGAVPTFELQHPAALSACFPRTFELSSRMTRFFFTLAALWSASSLASCTQKRRREAHRHVPTPPDRARRSRILAGYVGLRKRTHRQELACVDAMCCIKFVSSARKFVDRRIRDALRDGRSRIIHSSCDMTCTIGNRVLQLLHENTLCYLLRPPGTLQRCGS